MQPLRVVPMHPAEGRQFQVLDRLPRTGSGGSADEFGLVVAIDGNAEGSVDSGTALI